LVLSLLVTAGIFIFIQRKIFHAQADMRKTQKILEKTIEFMPVAVVVLAPYSDEYIYINKAMKQVIDSGLTYYIDESYAKFVEVKNDVVESGEVYEGENEIGNQVFHYYVSPICDSMENIQFVMIQVVDVTETRVKERETHAALVRLDQLIERDVDAVAFVQPIYDEDGKIRSGQYYKVNKEFCELMHLSPDDILGKEMSGFLISNDFLNLFYMLTDTTPLVRFSYFKSENEGQYLSGFVFEVGTNPSLFCIHLTDETEYYYHHLIEKSATQRLETMLTELAILNDQIRNPLTVILCSLESDTIHAQAEFETEISNINTAIDLLDRRFLIVDSLRARIKEKEKERMQDEHFIREFNEEEFL
jgi:PAS domain-containing protein